MNYVSIRALVILLLAGNMGSSAEGVTVSRKDVIESFKNNVRFHNEYLFKTEADQLAFLEGLQIEKVVATHFPPSVQARNEREKAWILKSTNLIFNYDDPEFNTLYLREKLMTISLKSKFTVEYAAPELTQEQIGLISDSVSRLFGKVQGSIRTHLPLLPDDDVRRYSKDHLTSMQIAIIDPMSLKLKKELAPEDIEAVSKTFDARLESTKALAFERLEEIRNRQDLSEEDRKVREQGVLEAILKELFRSVLDQIEKRTEVQPAKSLEGLTGDSLVPGYRDVTRKMAALRSKNRKQLKAKREKDREAAKLMNRLKVDGTLDNTEKLIDEAVGMPIDIANQSTICPASTIISLQRQLFLLFSYHISPMN